MPINVTGGDADVCGSTHTPHNADRHCYRNAHFHSGVHLHGNAHTLRHGHMSEPNGLGDADPAPDADAAPDSRTVGDSVAHRVADDFALTRLSPGRYAGPCHRRLHERERVLLPGATGHHNLGGIGDRDGLHDVRRLMDLAQPVSRDRAAGDDLYLGNRAGRHDTACHHIRGHG